MLNPTLPLPVRHLALRLALAFLLIGALALPAHAKIPACGEVDGDRAAIASAVAVADAACPCGGFAKKSEYAKCFRAEVDAAILGGSLRKQCKTTAMRAATKSTCGAKPGAVTCCKTDARGKATCGIAASADKCVAPKGGTATVGATSSCYDACWPSCESSGDKGQLLNDAVAIAVLGQDDPWGEDLRTVLKRVEGELSCRAGQTQVGPARVSRAAATQDTQDCEFNYCSDVDYCGKGRGNWYDVGAGSCMNQHCWDHDNCYPQECVQDACPFAPQGSGGDCDETFLFGACTLCAVQDWTSAFICAVAASLKGSWTQPGFPPALLNPQCLNPPCAAGQTCNPSSGMCETPQPTPTPHPDCVGVSPGAPCAGGGICRDDGSCQTGMCCMCSCPYTHVGADYRLCGGSAIACTIVTQSVAGCVAASISLPLGPYPSLGVRNCSAQPLTLGNSNCNPYGGPNPFISSCP